MNLSENNVETEFSRESVTFASVTSGLFFCQAVCILLKTEKESGQARSSLTIKHVELISTVRLKIHDITLPYKI